MSIVICTCVSAIQQLRTHAHSNKVLRQVKEHKDAVLDLIDNYLTGAYLPVWRVAHVTSLLLNLTVVIPGEPGLSSTRMSPFWILLELRMMEVVVTTGAIRHAKLQSKCHHQQTNSRVFTGRMMPFLSPNQGCQGTEGKIGVKIDHVSHDYTAR